MNVMRTKDSGSWPVEAAKAAVKRAGGVWSAVCGLSVVCGPGLADRDWINATHQPWVG